MTAIAKSAKTHPAAKKFCGWEEPAIYVSLCVNLSRMFWHNIALRCTVLSDTFLWQQLKPIQCFGLLAICTMIRNH